MSSRKRGRDETPAPRGDSRPGRSASRSKSAKRRKLNHSPAKPIHSPTPSGQWYRSSGSKFLLAHAHGNFDSAYGRGGAASSSLSSSSEDSRLSYLDGLVKPADTRLLDAGCGNGVLTTLIAERFSHLHQVVGVDVDQPLLLKARALLTERQQQALQAQQTQSQPQQAQQTKQVSGLDLSSLPLSLRMCQNVTPAQLQLLGSKASSSSSSASSASPGAATPQAERILFLYDDLGASTSNPLPALSHCSFDVITAFSLLKWLHITQGDEGLKCFFRRSFALLRPGGRLVLSVPHWASYRRTVKNMLGSVDAPAPNSSAGVLKRRNSDSSAASGRHRGRDRDRERDGGREGDGAPLLRSLKLRPDDFTSYLLDTIGFDKCEKVKMVEASGDDAPQIYVLTKR
jgi:SAM-dependent methyltransferase